MKKREYDREYDLVILGGGPGGYVAAIRAGQLGWSVACVDENANLGGTCLRVGCIPSKALLESSEKYAEAGTGLADHGVIVGDVQLDLAAMHRRRAEIVATLAKGVASLLKKNGVTRIQGRGRLAGPGKLHLEGSDGESEIHAKRILIATGSLPASLAGIDLDGDRIGSSTEALTYTEVPKHLVVIGAGYIGLEMGSVWSRLGSKVTVLEALDCILPGMDSELARAMQKILEKQGLEFRLRARVEQVVVKGEHCELECAGAETIQCDRVLVAVGRVPNTTGIGLETLDIEVDESGQIPVSDNFQTTAEGIYAIGDCIHGPKLAHKASHEALACVDGLVGGRWQVNYDTIPGVVYTHPELATVGKTEEQLAKTAASIGKAYSRSKPVAALRR